MNFTLNRAYTIIDTKWESANTYTDGYKLFLYFNIKDNKNKIHKIGVSSLVSNCFETLQDNRKKKLEKLNAAGM